MRNAGILAIVGIVLVLAGVVVWRHFREPGPDAGSAAPIPVLAEDASLGSEATDAQVGGRESPPSPDISTPQRRQHGPTEERRAGSLCQSGDHDVITAEVEVVRLGYQDEIERMKRPPGTIWKAREFDAQLRTALSEIMDALKSFDDTRARMSEVVDFIEFPEQTRAGLFETFPVEGPAEDTKPVVLYKRVKGEAGVELIVCQNSLVVTDDGMYRVGCVPYAIVVAEDAISVGELLPWFSEPDQAPVAYANVALPVDTFDAGTAVPSIVILRGPAGKGGYLNLDVASYSDETAQWKLEAVTEFDGIAGWVYDPESDVLTLTSLSALDGSSNTCQIQIDELVSDPSKRTRAYP